MENRVAGALKIDNLTLKTEIHNLRVLLTNFLFQKNLPTA